MKFSLIICRKVENSVNSFRTLICLDVSVGETFEIGVSFSNIEIQLYIIAKTSLVNMEFALCEL